MTTKEELEKIAKNQHESFLSLPETQILIKNLIKDLEVHVDVILRSSVLKELNDAQIRTLCAEAHAKKELIDYVTKNYLCIVEFKQ